MRRLQRNVVASLAALAFAATALAGSHTWDVNELFTNADGTIQFIELHEANGTPNEIGVGGHNLTSNSSTYLIPSNVASPTTFRFLLFATAGFAALPGAPTPDFIIPDNFLSAGGDTISYVPWDSLTFPAGRMPTDGVMSLNRDLTTGVNSPTNYAGQTGSVNAAPPGPPAVPADVTAERLSLDGSSLSVAWDTATCTDAADYQIIFGEGTQLPSSLGGAFGVGGAVCSLGTSSPFAWNGVPSSSDGSGLIWWIVVARNGTDEGSWGLDGSDGERLGPGVGGSSGQCGTVDKDLTNSCGQ